MHRRARSTCQEHREGTSGYSLGDEAVQDHDKRRKKASENILRNGQAQIYIRF